MALMGRRLTCSNPNCYGRLHGRWWFCQSCWWVGRVFFIAGGAILAAAFYVIRAVR